MILELRYDSITKKISFDTYVGDESNQEITKHLNYDMLSPMIIFYSIPIQDDNEWKTKNLLLKEFEKDMREMYNYAFSAISQVKYLLY